MAIKTVFNPPSSNSSGGGTPTTTSWGDITGSLPAQTDLKTALDAKVTGLVNSDKQVVVTDNAIDYPIASLNNTSSPLYSAIPVDTSYDLKNTDNNMVVPLHDKISVLNFPLISTLTLPFKCRLISTFIGEFGASITLQGTDSIYFTPNNTGATGTFYLPVAPIDANSYNVIDVTIGTPPSFTNDLAYILGGIYVTDSFSTPDTAGLLTLSNATTLALGVGDRVPTDGLLRVGKSNGLALLDEHANVILPNSDTADIFVTAQGNDTTGNGTFNFPYLTLAKAYSVATFGEEINLGSGEFTEDLIINGKDNIGVKSFNERFYGGSGNHTGNCVIKGNVTISGATTTRTRLAGFQIGTGGIGGNLTITDTLGRMYVRNSYVSGDLIFNGASDKWFEFHECGFGGNVSIFEAGVPNTGVTIRFFNSSFEGATLTIGANVTVEFHGCGRIPTVIATDGNVYIRDFKYIQANASNECVVFSSTGTLYLENGSLLQFSAPNDYGKINMSAGAGYYVGKVGRLSEVDILSGVNLGHLDNSRDSMYEHDASFYPVGVTNIKDALDYIASNLPQPLEASIISLDTRVDLTNATPWFIGWETSGINQSGITVDATKTIITFTKAGTYQVIGTFYGSLIATTDTLQFIMVNSLGTKLPDVTMSIISGTAGTESNYSQMGGFIEATAGMEVRLRSVFMSGGISLLANSQQHSNQLNFLKVN